MDDPQDITTFGAAPNLLRRLLAMGLRASQSDALEDLLAQELPGTLPAEATRPRTLGDLLLDPGTDLAALRAAKNHGKTLAGGAPGDAEAAAALVLYYGAIASARVFHQASISRLAPDTLARSFRKLASERWMPPRLQDLFRRAESSGTRTGDGL